MLKKEKGKPLRGRTSESVFFLQHSSSCESEENIPEKDPLLKNQYPSLISILNDPPNRVIVSKAAPKRIVSLKEKTLKCPVCTKHFRSMKFMKRHIESLHTGVKNFHCPTCSLSFHWRAHLMRHMAGKCNGKYTCTACSKSFTREVDLAGHIECHPVKRIFCCRKCPQSFEEKSDLTTHIATMHGYSCAVCPLWFERKGDLTNHVKATHGVGFACPVCGRVFTEKSNRTRHVKLKHSKTQLEVNSQDQQTLNTSSSCDTHNTTITSRSYQVPHVRELRSLLDVIEEDSSKCTKPEVVTVVDFESGPVLATTVCIENSDSIPETGSPTQFFSNLDRSGGKFPEPSYMEREESMMAQLSRMTTEQELWERQQALNGHH